MEAIAVDKERFVRRRKRLTDAMASWPYDALVILLGREGEDVGDLKTTSMHVWLLSAEFPETAMAICKDGTLFFWTSARKAGKLQPLESDSVRLIQRASKTGVDQEQLDAFCKEVLQGKEKARVGIVMEKEAHVGDFVREVLARFLDSPQFDVQDCSNEISQLLGVQDEDELASSRRAGFFCAMIMSDFFTRRLEEVVDNTEEVSAVKICEEVQRIEDDANLMDFWVRKHDLEVGQLSIASVSLQHGSSLELRGVPPAGGTISFSGTYLLHLAVQYCEYHSCVTRTLAVDPPLEQKRAYHAVFQAQIAVINAVAPGRAFGALYAAAQSAIQEIAPELAPKLGPNVGWILGLQLEDPLGHISATSTRAVEPGMVLNIAVGIVEKSEDGAGQAWATWLSDTVIVPTRDGPLEIPTSGSSKDPADVLYEVDGEGPTEQQSEQPPPSNPLAPAATSAEESSSVKRVEAEPFTEPSDSAAPTAAAAAATPSAKAKASSAGKVRAKAKPNAKAEGKPAPKKKPAPKEKAAAKGKAAAKEKATAKGKTAAKGQAAVEEAEAPEEKAALEEQAAPVEEAVPEKSTANAAPKETASPKVAPKEKAAAKGKAAAKEKAAHEEEEKAAPEEEAALEEKAAASAKEEAAPKEKRTPKKKAAPKAKCARGKNALSKAKKGSQDGKDREPSRGTAAPNLPANGNIDSSAAVPAQALGGASVRSSRRLRAKNLQTIGHVQDQVTLEEEMVKRRAALLEQQKRVFNERVANVEEAATPSLVGLNAYPTADDLPKDLRPQRIHVDLEAETVVLPMFGQWVPVTAKVVRSITKSQSDHSAYIRVNFGQPGGQAKLWEYSPVVGGKKMSIKEISFKSDSVQNFENVIRSFKELQRRMRVKELEDDRGKQWGKLASEAGKGLRLFDQSTDFPRLMDLQMRPNISGMKRGFGTLQAHTNGFRFLAKDTTAHVDILYSQVKLAIFEPRAEHNFMALVHFHLHEPVIFGTKRTRDIQFFTEVGVSSEDLHVPRTGLDNDPHEFQEEQHLRMRRTRLNKAFHGFAKRVEALETCTIKFDVPWHGLLFSGRPINITVDLCPCERALVGLQTWPPLCLSLADVECAVFERDLLGLHDLDMTFVFKDYKRPPLRITAVSMRHRDSLRTWLYDNDVVWYTCALSLNWKEVMAWVTQHPQGFLDNGGWSSFSIAAGSDGDGFSSDEDFEASGDATSEESSDHAMDGGSGSSNPTEDESDSSSDPDSGSRTGDKPEGRRRIREKRPPSMPAPTDRRTKRARR